MPNAISNLAVLDVAWRDGRMAAFHEALHALATELATALPALPDLERDAVADCFTETLMQRIDGDGVVGAAVAARAACYQLAVASLSPCVTGGADWSVTEAYAVHATRDMEGIFLLRDDEYGCWSVVHRLHDEDGNAEIVPLIEDDDWPVVVNEALRIYAERP